MLRAELYQPDGDGPYPAVILMHGCGGSQPPVRDAMHTHAEYLVGHGFVALVLEQLLRRDIMWICSVSANMVTVLRVGSLQIISQLGRPLLITFKNSQTQINIR